MTVFLCIASRLVQNDNTTNHSTPSLPKGIVHEKWCQLLISETLILRKTHLRTGAEVSLYHTVSQRVLPLKFSTAMFSNIERLKRLLVLNHLKSQTEQ